MSEFFFMDGFAVWVWTSFGVTAAAMLVTAVLVIRRHRRRLRLLAQKYRQGD